MSTVHSLPALTSALAVVRDCTELVPASRAVALIAFVVSDDPASISTAYDLEFACDEARFEMHRLIDSTSSRKVVAIKAVTAAAAPHNPISASISVRLCAAPRLSTEEHRAAD